MQVMKWSALALAVTAGTTQLAFASAQSDSKGFVEDSDLQLLNKNYALYRDFRNNGVNNGGKDTDQNYRNEWAHGVMATYASGYTQGTVGFGVDAHAAQGFKLNSVTAPMAPACCPSTAKAVRKTIIPTPVAP